MLSLTGEVSGLFSEPPGYSPAAPLVCGFRCGIPAIARWPLSASGTVGRSSRVLVVAPVRRGDGRAWASSPSNRQSPRHPRAFDYRRGWGVWSSLNPRGESGGLLTAEGFVALYFVCGRAAPPRGASVSKSFFVVRPRGSESMVSQPKAHKKKDD